MEIIGFLVFGLVVGAIAKFFLPGKDPGGLFATAIIGMVGSLLGGLIGREIFGRGPSYVPGWAMSIFGAIVVLVLFRLFRRRTGG